MKKNLDACVKGLLAVCRVIAAIPGKAGGEK